MSDTMLEAIVSLACGFVFERQGFVRFTILCLIPRTTVMSLSAIYAARCICTKMKNSLICYGIFCNLTQDHKRYNHQASQILMSYCMCPVDNQQYFSDCIMVYIILSTYPGSQAIQSSGVLDPDELLYVPSGQLAVLLRLHYGIYHFVNLPRITSDTIIRRLRS